MTEKPGHGVGETDARKRAAQWTRENRIGFRYWKHITLWREAMAWSDHFHAMIEAEDEYIFIPVDSDDDAARLARGGG